MSDDGYRPHDEERVHVTLDAEYRDSSLSDEPGNYWVEGLGIDYIPSTIKDIVAVAPARSAKTPPAVVQALHELLLDPRDSRDEAKGAVASLGLTELREAADVAESLLAHIDAELLRRGRHRVPPKSGQ